MANKQVVCPHGHRVPREAVTFDGERPQCPVCTALGQSTSAEKWSWPGAATRPAVWSRQALSGVLWAVALGFAVLAVGDYFALQNYRHTVQLSTTTAEGASHLAAVIGHALIALASAAAARIVDRP